MEYKTERQHLLFLNGKLSGIALGVLGYSRH